MIVGIGTDVCSIERIRKSLDRFGERLVKRILTPDERPRFARVKDKAGHRRSASPRRKRSKAIGTGIHAPFTWHSITVTRNPRGKPGIEPNPAMAGHLKKMGVTVAHLSLTDDGDVAMAFVVLEGKG